MTNPEPVNTVNLDQYGHEALPWSAVAERLESATTSGQDVFTVLGTVLPDGRPHAAAVGALWIDGAWYVVTGPGSSCADRGVDGGLAVHPGGPPGLGRASGLGSESVTGALDARR